MPETRQSAIQRVFELQRQHKWTLKHFVQF